jgi:hypothetical protein
MSEESGSGFEKRTREVLEESAARLDGHTQSRLTRARHAALERLERPARTPWRMYLPAGMAAAAVLVVLLWAKPGGDSAPLAQATGPVEDMELLADADAAEFIAEGDELEFYVWAAGELES